jgi:iron complex outermembrane receptor protein
MYAQPGFGVANNVIGNLALGAAVAPLKPQTLSSVEAVAYTLLGDVAAFELAAFYQRLSDKIEFSAAGTDQVARNTGRSSYAGVESSLRLSFWRLSPYLSANILRLLGGEGAMANGLPSYPRLNGSAGLDAELLLAPRLHLTALVRYVGARGATAQNILQNFTNPYELPAFTSADLGLSTGQLSLLGEASKTRFALSIRNLLDERHSEPGYGGFDIPAAGRSVFFEVQQTF